jgi:type VI secretion system secreted protein Hcp
MRLDGSLRIDAIPGESRRDGHEDEMEVHGVEFSMEAPFDQNTMSRRGRVSLSTITFTKHYDRGSPYLKKACFDNTLFEQVVFAARRTVEGETSDYLVVTLTDSSVVSYVVRPSSDTDDLLEERVAFAFGSIAFSYDDTHEVTLEQPRRR